MSDSHSTSQVVERRAIPGFPGYHVDSNGDVWSSKRLVYFPGVKSGCRSETDGPMKKLNARPTTQPPGYLMVRIQRADGKQFGKLVHRLVAEVFLGACPDGMQCRHLDGNAKNNHLSNLTWGTPSENCRDRIRHGTQCHMKGESNGNRSLTSEQVAQIRARYAQGGISYKKLGALFKTSASNIRFIVIGATW